MQLYHKLSQIPFLQKYSRKFLFVAFIGIHVPLLGVTATVLLIPNAGFTGVQLLGMVLSFTLLATAITMYLLNSLTSPILRVKDALETYLYTQAVPDLPTHYRDEAGLLMQDVQHAIESLDKLLNEKKDTINRLSHDLRSPVNSVLSILEEMRHEKDPRELAQYFTHIEQLLKGQLDLMTSMLSIMQDEETWHLVSNKSSVRFGTVLQSALNQLEGNLMRKGIAMDLQFTEDIEIVVEKQHFEQVLYNVIGNAIKFSHTGSLITVTARNEAGSVIITVEDEGIGFRPSYAEELFERFTERRRWGTENEPTNGVGLYLCRKVMRRQGGDIVGSSMGEGKGSVFTLTLPQAVSAPKLTPPVAVIA